jgi:hypothetical protein
MERKLACVEAKRLRSPGAADIGRILAEMRSSDEQVRAQAVREVCPCRMPWETFGQVRQAAKRLQHDPSPLVRASALHVEEDAREIAALEALREWMAEHGEDVVKTTHRPRKRGERWHAERGEGQRQQENDLV